MSQSLTIEPLGATIEVEEGQTLLDAALRQGIYIPHACGHGLCGTCKVQVADGEVEHGAANPFALMDFERDEGKALACCATLLSDATIEGILVGTRSSKEIEGAAKYSGMQCRIISFEELHRQITLRDDAEFADLLSKSIVSRLPDQKMRSTKAATQAADTTERPGGQKIGAVGDTVLTSSHSGRATPTTDSDVDEKYRYAFSNAKLGDVFSRSEINTRILSAFPGEITAGGVLPSDRCYNITNSGLGSNRTFRVFEYVGRNKYKYLGENFRYNGLVTWKNIPCGSWVDGVLTKWENWPVLKAEQK